MLDEEHFLNRGQFVFDRNAGDQLVTLNKVPGSHKLAWGERDEDAEFNVIVDNGGYDRIIGSPLPFMLLLTLIKIKWWPEFNYGDDYCNDDLIMNELKDLGLDVVLKKKNIDFDAALKLYLQSSEQYNTKLNKDNKGDPSLFPEEDLEETSEKNNNLKPDLRLVHPNPEEISIDDMDLSPRSYNCLKKSGVETLSQLLKYSKNDLKATRNLGRRCFEEVIKEIIYYGYELSDDD